MMYHRNELMKHERDFGSVQNFFVKAPVEHGLPIEEIIADADMIFSILPEEKLIALSSKGTKKKLDEGRYTETLQLANIKFTEVK